MTDPARPLIAYELHAHSGFTLVPAPATRDWMLRSPGRFAARCLPLLIANQSGWLLLNNATLRVMWNGEAGLDALTVEYENEPPPLHATSHFGQGIVTWNLPFLFRTPPGYNLHVRGPVNHIKDGIAALEGIVETDWAVAPAFQSWQLSRRDHTVVWEDGEPICSIIPQRRGELEEWAPEVRDVFAEPALANEYVTFSESRTQFNATRPRAWQKDYFLGRSPGSAVAEEHQTRLHLRSFTGAGRDGPEPLPTSTAEAQHQP